MLAEALLRYPTSDQVCRDRIAESNRRLIESRLSIRAWVDQVCDLYAELLAK